MYMTIIILKALVELALGVCIKLFIENGRLHKDDLMNDLFFWLPGVQAQEGDGLGRQIESLVPTCSGESMRASSLAA